MLKKYLYWRYLLWNKIMLRNAQCAQPKPRIFGPILIKNQGKLTFGSGVRINSHKWANVIGGDQRASIVVLQSGEMHIGNNVGFSNCAFFCTHSIRIGNNVMIGGSCKMWDTDFHSLDSQVRLTDPNGGYKSAPIVIHDNAFIGANSIILKGVTIGENAIVGAGSVVTKSIPANEIWAGNPAKFIRTCS